MSLRSESTNESTGATTQEGVPVKDAAPLSGRAPAGESVPAQANESSSLPGGVQHVRVSAGAAPAPGTQPRAQDAPSEDGPRSLAARLTAWYALSAFAM